MAVEQGHNRLRRTRGAVLAVASVTAAVLAASSGLASQPVPAGTLTGYIWFDANNNGAHDPDEPRVSATMMALKYTSRMRPPDPRYPFAGPDGVYKMDNAVGTYAVGAEFFSLPPRDPAMQGATAATVVDIPPGRTITLNLGLRKKGQPSSVAAPAAVDGKIQVVWPRGGKPADDAEAVNIEAYLFERGTTKPVPCAWNPRVRLWAAVNDQPATLVGFGEKRIVSEGDITFPAWFWNDVDVSIARQSGNKVYFFLTVGDPTAPFEAPPGRFAPTEKEVPTRSNVWAHAADARTYLPQAGQPRGTVRYTPVVDASIQIVWPHDEDGNEVAPEQAPLVNITAALFDHDYGLLRRSFPPGRGATLKLYQSLNNGLMEEVAIGVDRLAEGEQMAPHLVDTLEAFGMAYPAWDFNNINVRHAADPANKYFFMVAAEGVVSYPNIWVHGADARTYFPQKDVPSSSCD